MSTPNCGRDQGNSHKAEPMTSEHEPRGPFDRWIHASRTQATPRLEASCGSNRLSKVPVTRASYHAHTIIATLEYRFWPSLGRVPSFVIYGTAILVHFYDHLNGHDPRPDQTRPDQTKYPPTLLLGSSQYIVSSTNCVGIGSSARRGDHAEGIPPKRKSEGFVRFAVGDDLSPKVR